MENDYCLLLEINDIAKQLNESTRMKEVSQSELDQIITNCGYIIYDIAMTASVSYNDHCTISGKVRFNVKRPQTYQRIMRQYDLACFDLYRDRLNVSFEQDDIDVVTRRWTDILVTVARYIIPNKVVTVRPWDKQFYNGYIRQLRRAKDRAHHPTKHDNTAEAWNAFIFQRSHNFLEIRRLKSETEHKLLAGISDTVLSNSCKWWTTSKRLLYNQSQTIPNLDIIGNSVSDDQDKARVFNDYCIECSSVDNSHATFLDNYDALTDSTLSSMETSVEDVNTCHS